MKMKINFRKPKYIIPALAILPILFIGYQICGMLSFEVADDTVVTEDVNTDMPGVNEEKIQIKSKYQSMLDGYGKVTDYTGVDNVEKEEVKKEEVESVYDDAQIRFIDSLNQIRQQEQERLKKMIEENNRERERTHSMIAFEDEQEKDKVKKQSEELKEQLQLIQKMTNGERILTQEEMEQEQKQREIQRLKKQIADSISALKDPVQVTKVARANEQHFNTIEEGDDKPNLIRGRVDEMVKAKDGSRLRIRLADDVEIKGTIIPKGTYVYANVTGFTAQRVKAQVKSMMVGGKITPVELNVYDLDCQEGFYVPQSSFRELAKDIGSGAMNMNMNINSSTGEQNLQSIAMQSLQQAMTATTSAISKNIRQNKAKIKYNTEIYLISNNN